MLPRLSNLACAGKEEEGIGGTVSRSWFWLVCFLYFLFLWLGFGLGFKMEFEFDSNPSKLADKHRKQKATQTHECLNTIIMVRIV